ncbi:hypothetical protein [Mesorhizobium sp. 43Arga]
MAKVNVAKPPILKAVAGDVGEYAVAAYALSTSTALAHFGYRPACESPEGAGSRPAASKFGYSEAAIKPACIDLIKNGHSSPAFVKFVETFRARA